MPVMTPAALRRFLDEDARRLGFDAVGVASAEEDAAAAGRLREFIEAGRHGTMGWLPETAERRRSVRSLWPEARTVIVLGLNYGPDEDPLRNLAERSSGTISVYARHRDYHEVIKGRLKELAGRLVSRAAPREEGGRHDAKVFVDTAPLMEKPLGQAAGLGWQGKHTNLVSRSFGSWLFLGSIVTTVPLEPDRDEQDHCGSCRLCQDACPTAAFPEPYKLDARRCISYLTIETRQMVPREMRPLFGNRIYGCDDCLAVCPWNKFAAHAREIKLRAREDLRSPPLRELLQLDDARFRLLFSGSPVKRIGRAKFVSNCLIAAGNSGDAALVDPVEILTRDEAPIVRLMAAWALRRLDPARALAGREAALASERDEEVRSEWNASD